MKKILVSKKSPTKKEKVNSMIVDDPKFFNRLWYQSLSYVKTVVEVLREPILILNQDLCILAANDPFLETFKVKKIDTIGQHVYKLGNGQWNIPELRKLLSEILPQHTFFKGFQVAHVFPVIGRKVMFLNSRQIFYNDGVTKELFSPIILLAIEDVTEIMDVAERVKVQKEILEAIYLEKTKKIEAYTHHLEKKIEEIIIQHKEELVKNRFLNTLRK